MPARQCEQHQHRQSGSPRLLIDTKEIGALAHSLFACWQVNLIAVLDDQFSFKVEAEGDFFFFAATLNATSSNTKDVWQCLSVCLFFLCLCHTCYFCVRFWLDLLLGAVYLRRWSWYRIKQVWGLSGLFSQELVVRLFIETAFGTAPENNQHQAMNLTRI